MDIAYNKELTKTSYQFLREAGYIPIHDRKTGKQSYVYRLTGARYPRFHIYIKEESSSMFKIHLHLDNKEHGWGQRLHDTEYDSEQVKAEGARLQRWLVHFTVKEKTEEQPEEKKTTFISKLFGG